MSEKSTFSKSVQCILADLAANSLGEGELKPMHLLSREDLIRQVFVSIIVFISCTFC